MVHNVDDVTKQKELVHLVAAEPNTKHWALWWINIGYFIDEWHHPEEQDANAQKPKHPGGM